MAPQPFHQVRPPDDDPRLRSTEKLVSREADEIRARPKAFGRGWLVADARESTRAEVVDEWDTMPLPDLGELCEPRLLGEPDDSEVRLVHPEQDSGLGPDHVLVVGSARPVRRPHLHETGARARKHVRDSKAVADLDQLAA